MDEEQENGCAICLEPYDTQEHVPRYLACYHSFCQKCLQDLISRRAARKKVECPKCRLEEPITAKKGVQQFQINKYIVSQIEQQNQVNRRCRKHGRPTTLWCSEAKCKEYVCQICFVSAHKHHKVQDTSLEKRTRNYKRESGTYTPLDELKEQREDMELSKEHITRKTNDTLKELETKRKVALAQINAAFDQMEDQVTHQYEKSCTIIDKYSSLLDENITSIDQFNRSESNKNTGESSTEPRQDMVEQIVQKILTQMRTVQDFKCATYVQNESLSQDTLANLLGNICIEKVPRRFQNEE